MEIKTLDKAGLELIAKFEGVVLKPYRDQVGIPTIGIGMTYYPSTGKKVTMSDKPLTLEQAYSEFAKMVKPYELGVYSVMRDDLTQKQFNALVSLCYNIGVGGFKGSTVARLVNQNITGEPLNKAFLMWNKAGGKVLPGLTKRRQQEFDYGFKAC
jgi:lysozyme